MKVMCIFDWILSVRDFIMESPEDPFIMEKESVAEDVVMSSPEVSRQTSRDSTKTTSPLTVSSGIMTKRGPIVEEVEVPFELKLNVSDTQFIVVEDSSTWDTNAVILKSTAILNFRPKAKDKILTCTLQSLEVFSCSLTAEEETAQSIIDPLTIHIDLNANPLPKHKLSSSAGLLEASQVHQNNLVLEITFNVMNIRLSYIDMKMFLAILNSIPEQALKATQHDKPTDKAYPADKISSLYDMGFSMEDCKKALDLKKMNLMEAAVWLTENAVPEERGQSQEGGLHITGMEIKSSSVCVCLIDDCGDSDVPLAEISFNSIQFSQQFLPRQEGSGSFILMGDYYNRKLSGWEPFLEQWKCRCEWKQYYQNMEKKTAIQINAQEVLNLNITSTLLELYNQTKVTWSEDYYKQIVPANSQNHPHQASRTAVSCQRRRVPFVPFMLSNETGCTLWFTTVTTTPRSGRRKGTKDDHYIKASEWRKVESGEKMPFFFHNKEKNRHEKTHELSINQLVVKVDGWLKLSNVSVDRVGVYFRHAEPDVSQAKGLAGLTYSSKHDPSIQKPARIVFDVKQEGKARKLITVRSALIVRNELDSSIDLKMATHSGLEGKFNIMEIPANGTLPLPLPYVSSMLYVRPSDWPVKYCNQPIQWQHVGLAGEVKERIMKCDSSEGNGVYRFCVSVKRENYPEQLLTEDSSLILPGHTVSIRPPVIIRNLLPIELRYYIKDTQICGTVKTGEKAYLHAADPQQAMELGLNLENFPACKELVVPPVTTGPQYHKVKIRLYDTKKRLLELLIKIIFRKGGSVSIHVTAPYWLVNKSGLPLVFRQDFSQQDAAGQYEEHELARSVTPLLFCYAEKDLPNLCTMRVGKSVQGPDSVPVWCKRFSLESGTGMRRLNVVPKTGNRPDWVYNIGIGVHQGKGLYADTNIVTFAPLYEIDNQSSHRLAIAQRHLAQSETMKLDTCLIALPQCKLPFHWPRLDLDQLLCVNLLDVGSSSWSGGFRIDKTDSFHINIRDDQNVSHLLKVEIVMEGPTYFIVFGDAGEVPPPIRIDNWAEIPVEYFQSDTTEQKLKAFVQPRVQLPYAWDEPMLSHSITLRVKGGTSATYNMDKLEEGKQLCYPNFIYLRASATFPRSTQDSPHTELVLEVVQDQYIKFCKKEIGNRNQLWRMTSGGMLEHEGSISPRDPHNRSSYPSGKSMVLDIDDIAPRPGRIVPLTLRKRDERRKATQTWKFTEDGRLCCVDGAMCVQTLGGGECLRDSAVAVVGPGPPSGRSVPAHMKIDRQRLLPGSGCLAVRTVMDGPIRVLQITDVSQGSVAEVTKNYQDWVVCEEDKVAEIENKSTEKKSSLEICMSLKDGLGLSLVNYSPEELVYISLQNISLDYISNPNYMTVDVAVANVQVDNQLFTATRPVLLYITPTPRRDIPENTPALHVVAQKIPNSKWNAEIYKHLIVNMKKLSIQVEEELLWKLLQFCGFGSTDHLDEKVTEGEDPRKALAAATSVKTKRYYFGLLKIHTSRVNLSMLTASKLSADLKALKRDMSLPLVRFEDAKVDLDPFIKSHLFETIVFLQKEIRFHYTEELKSQAAKILGSVDFLGNPLGLFNDVTEGISGLINDGNVGGLLKNVTHGVSNSAAKVVGSLSDGLGTLNMDKNYQDRREQLRTGAQSSGGHILAGVKGFGNGLFGAVTSIFTQPYDGFKEDGIEGLVTGIGKGVIGTVTKPVVGVLDLASGAANAIRDTSSSSSRISPPPLRLPRCCHGAGMLLPPYSQNDAKSQKLLHDLNKKNLEEFFIAVEQLRREDRLMSLITSKQVYFLLGGEADSGNIILKVPHKELFQCLVVEIKGRYYLELVRVQTSDSDQQRVPQIRCDKQTVAERVSQQINYAHNLYEEQQHTLTSTEAEDT
ncbi:intermembrane lipid transfer protein VPS13D-like isoform X2 [Saccostrea cucullata]|uniref:intermembrane lipid transfer protein VPS13D-like isoform X2 n=1 Tax=Saccostrea cuccullata TaxID=36930 RepID=UPI002ED04516